MGPPKRGRWSLAVSEGSTRQKPRGQTSKIHDHFKKYNDQYGHLAGDDVLRRVANVLGAVRHTGGSACRYGGGEFCFLLPEPSLVAATAAVDRIREAVQALAIPHSCNPSRRW